MKLTSEQLKHLPSIQWLVDDKIGGGKTTLILYALVLKAIQNPGRDISIIDHVPMSLSQWERIITRLLTIMLTDEEFKNYNIKINYYQKTIRYK